MGRTVSSAPGYAPDSDEFDPRLDDFVSTERNYQHFDRPLDLAAREALRANEATILANSFWPLLAFQKTERRVTRDKKSGEARFKEKTREIKFCSHQDAALLERYTSWLSKRYESDLAGKLYSSCVLAYRRGVGNNISQAKSLFDEIRSRGSVTAVAMDITGFFDHIRHDVLLRELKDVLAAERLTAADYKVFRRMTNFEWVEVDQVEERLSGRVRLRGRLCDGYQFRTYIRRKGDSLVKVNENAFGIPQGTPLSGLYANISLKSFDEKMHQYFSDLGGSYRRYSDDIALVLPENVEASAQIDFVTDTLAEIGLSVSSAKTDVSHFVTTLDGLDSDKPFQYLGFTFDGRKILIRQSSLNRYYSKMKTGVLAKVLAAKRNGIASDRIYMRELFRKYTHFGRHRNFPRYAYRAARVMNAPEIRRQLANHFEVFKEVVHITIEAVYT